LALVKGSDKTKESKSNVDGECTGDLEGDGKSDFTGDNGIAGGGEFFLTTSGLGFRFFVTFGAEFRTFNIASINNPLSLILAENKIIK